jgi:hypothetical protein
VAIKYPQNLPDLQPVYQWDEQANPKKPAFEKAQRPPPSALIQVVVNMPDFKGLFTRNTIFLLHLVVHTITLGFILIWSDAVIQHGVTKNLVLCKYARL